MNGIDDPEFAELDALFSQYRESLAAQVEAKAALDAAIAAYEEKDAAYQEALAVYETAKNALAVAQAEYDDYLAACEEQGQSLVNSEESEVGQASVTESDAGAELPETGDASSLGGVAATLGIAFVVAGFATARHLRREGC